MNSMPSFIRIVQAVKKLNSISRAWLNFRRRPILCTTLYRNLMQAGNSVADLANFSFEFFLRKFHRKCLSTFSLPWCKKVENDQKLKSRGSFIKLEFVEFEGGESKHENQVGTIQPVSESIRAQSDDSLLPCPSNSAKRFLSGGH